LPWGWKEEVEAVRDSSAYLWLKEMLVKLDLGESLLLQALRWEREAQWRQEVNPYFQVEISRQRLFPETSNFPEKTSRHQTIRPD
jgi:hypothetical protein